MHYQLEIVMPPTDDVKTAVTEIMKPWKEGNDDDDACPAQFWDWWVIGGRFAGAKFLARFEKSKIDAFYAALKEKGVTVAGLQCGKQELKPESQISMVDDLWNQMFPETEGRSCPLFAHSNDQYSSESLLPDDVCRLSDIPAHLEAERVIIAAPGYEGKGIEAVFMISRDHWNGCNHVKSDWDGTFAQAVEKFTGKLNGDAEQYVARCTPRDDWFVVTVDYHT